VNAPVRSRIPISSNVICQNSGVNPTTLFLAIKGSYQGDETTNVRVMVSLNRQGHIVTKYGKSRNITLHSCSASSPLPRVTNQHPAADSAAWDNIESELNAAALSLVSAPKGRLASST